jgi:hypothetical protein
MSETTPATPKTPSAARCNRVQQVLSKEPAFKPLLGTKLVKVDRRDGVKEEYLETVVAIATLLQDAHVDANICKKEEILESAKGYFNQAAKPAPIAGATAPVAGTVVPPAVAAVSSTKEALAEGACLSVYSLLLSAKEIGEHDRKPGAAGRLQKIQAALDAYEPLISVS